MVHVARRSWNPQIARGFFGTWAVLLTLVAVVVWVGQSTLGSRITKVEHTVETRVELCSTTASCRHLLNELLATVKPSDLAKLRQRVGVKPVARRRSVAPIARELAKRHAAVRHHTSTPPVVHHRPPAHNPVRPLPGPTPRPSSPAQAAPSPSASAPPRSSPPPPAITPPVPALPATEPPHLIEATPGKEGPLGLPCVKVLAVEVLCHPARPQP